MFGKLTQKADNILRQRFFKSAFAKPAPFVFTSHPQPVETGDYARGIRWISGEYFDDHQIHLAPNGNIWNCEAKSLNMLRDFHGFQWMDDLAIVNTAQADKLLKFWLKEWLERYRAGQGPGWDIETASWRLLRMITHGLRILSNFDTLSTERYHQSVGLHVRYVAKYYKKERSGIARVLPLTAWLYAALSLEDFNEDIRTIIEFLDDEANDLLTSVAAALPSRNPEELAELFCLYTWSDTTLREQRQDSGQNHLDFIDIAGRSLRALRLGSGALLQAHGGGPGQRSAIDHALSEAKVQGVDHRVPQLGFVPIRSGQLTIMMDCDKPPMQYPRAQASSLAIWVNDGAHPLITNIGCVKNQNFNTRILAQSTKSHSTLLIDGQNSSRFAFEKKPSESQWGGIIAQAANITNFNYEETESNTVVDCQHDGFVADFGLLHERKLSVDRDGLFFAGVDILRAATPSKTQALLNKNNQRGLPFEIQFILGPKLQPKIDLNAQAVSFVSPSGKVWVMRQTGAAVELSDKQLYDVKRVTPRPTKVITLRSRLVDTSGYISWSFQAYDA